ncbi:MAG TPA: S8 family serine peptidase [Tahibacter sp.]|uniref:S8 family serine peptidase n=1 Tax=Tahibacter sp. TaxID=2056211 RepID=UPI002BB77803|nr:S8 family serine peptidase [Tahibacter sp.]HSX62928.1 S8 family serine peptidase [Tahibacter sp.]
MRNALFLSIGLVLSLNAAAEDERCIVSFAAAQQNVCNGKIAHLNMQLDALARPDTAKDSTLRLIKFDGPITEQRRAAVESLGAQIVSYAPFNAYIVRMAPTLDASARTIPGVLWSGPFLPAFKVDPNIAAELEQGNIASRLGTSELEISLADSARRNAVETAVRQIPGLTFSRTVEAGPETRLIASFDRAQLRSSVDQLARNPDVIAVGLRMPSRLKNSQADWLHQSNVSTPTPLLPVFDRGLYGCGQIIGELDTGIHMAHCSFNDATQATPINVCTTGASCPTIAAPNNAARKVIAYYKWSGLAGTGPEDNHGHGTHVAGSIAGQNPANAVDCATFTTPGGNTDLDGTAPGAKLVMQESGANLAYLNTAGGNPYHAAQTAYANGARLHSNSWGGGCTDQFGACIAGCTVTYDAQARDADNVTGDNADLVMLFAAGNAGSVCPAGNNVGSPGNAKNVITIGATSRGTAANSMAGFSSRGPAEDSRTKPDITAQGSGIISAGRNTCGTQSMSGTSMATPTAAGLAALVREYLQRGFYPTGQKVQANAIANPSGALIKAILISGAATMTGTGAGAAPGQSQGFGRILLDNSLYFNGDASRLYIHDAPQGLATGGQDVHNIVVSAGAPLSIALTWTDKAAAVNANPALVNSLRLEVVAPNGDVWTQKLPANFSPSNANPIQDTTTANYDNRNNVHRITFANPSAGNYQIRVRGIAVAQGPQKYAIAATGSFQINSSPDFALMTTPTSLAICAGQPASLAVGVQSIAGFTAPVALSITGLPGGSTGTFTPASVVPADPAASSTLAISNTAGVAGGAYNVVVQGASTTPAVQHTASFTLGVTAAVPAAAALTTPANNATAVSVTPAFTWAAVADASSYRFQLSTSPTFASFVANEVVAATSFTPVAPLNPNVAYYWRVIAINTCGDAEPSATFSFTTENAICKVSNLSIPDANATGVSDTQTVAATGALTGLRLSVNATHTYVGDLTLTLTKGSTSVVFLQRPGNAANTGGSGCSGDNMNVVVDDAATNTLETNCAADPNPAYTAGASYKPNNPLSVFAATELSGDWTLKAVDSVGQDIGTLNRWCLLPVLPTSPTDVIFENGFE